jgi:hypothetical protein
MDLMIPIVFPSAPLREHPFLGFAGMPLIGVGERSRSRSVADRQCPTPIDFNEFQDFNGAPIRLRSGNACLMVSLRLS